MKPSDIWESTLFEYNMYLKGFELKGKNETANTILTGYYTAYYLNGGKKAKNPKTLIRSLYDSEVGYDKGMREIERIKKLEKEGKHDGSKN